MTDLKSIRRLVQECADGKLLFSGPGSLCEKVAAMGYSTTPLDEMVRLTQRIEIASVLVENDHRSWPQHLKTELKKYQRKLDELTHAIHEEKS